MRQIPCGLVYPEKSGLEFEALYNAVFEWLTTIQNPEGSFEPLVARRWSSELEFNENLALSRTGPRREKRIIPTTSRSQSDNVLRRLKKKHTKS